jgi:hypothetical protein
MPWAVLTFIAVTCSLETARTAQCHMGRPGTTVRPRSRQSRSIDNVDNQAADVGDDTWDAAAHLLTPDTPVAAFTGPVTLTAGRWGTIARTYIACTGDRALPPAAQRRFISEADAFTPGNVTEVRELATSHSPFLSQPEQLARVLLPL